MKSNPIEIQLNNNVTGMRIDKAIATLNPEISRNKIISLIKSGQILVNQKQVNPKDKVTGNEIVTILGELIDENKEHEAEDIPLNIVFEDEHILVVNKPVGLVVHPGNGNWQGTLLNAILHHHSDATNIPRAGIVHRLDKDTSGLMVIAKTLKAHTSLVKQLHDRTVSRTYIAIVHGITPKAGKINANIGRDPRNRIKMTTLHQGGKEAVTNYATLESFTDFSFIECRLDTGRTHQIRVHLQSIKHPLIGDPLYGKYKVNIHPEIMDAIKNLNRQALHAIKLSFIHPDTEKLVEFTCDIPSDIQAVLTAMRNYA